MLVWHMYFEDLIQVFPWGAKNDVLNAKMWPLGNEKF
jgi:hypothetical protein